MTPAAAAELRRAGGMTREQAARVEVRALVRQSPKLVAQERLILSSIRTHDQEAAVERQAVGLAVAARREGHAEGRYSDPTAIAAEHMERWHRGRVKALQTKLGRIAQQRGLLARLIDGLDDDEHTVSDYRAVGKSWAQIGLLMHYSYRHTQRIYRRAVDHMAVAYLAEIDDRRARANKAAAAAASTSADAG